ncbi:MAG: hypothetical protein KJ556_21410 [Gammaproteobacteria bacterium]|nr:hypothetical protein [Gammaproteobacteria bacterium]
MKHRIAGIALAGLAFCLVFGLLAEAEDNNIYVVQPFNAAAIDETNQVSIAYELSQFKPEGFFSFQIAVTGTGVVQTAKYELSNSGSDFVTPTGASDIVSNIASNSGPNSDGVTFVSFDPEIARFLRIRIAVTNGLATVSGWLAIQ